MNLREAGQRGRPLLYSPNQAVHRIAETHPRQGNGYRIHGLGDVGEPVSQIKRTQPELGVGDFAHGILNLRPTERRTLCMTLGIHAGSSMTRAGLSTWPWSRRLLRQ